MKKSILFAVLVSSIVASAAMPVGPALPATRGWSASAISSSLPPSNDRLTHTFTYSQNRG